MVVRNNLDRFHLVMDVIDRVGTLGPDGAAVRDEMIAKRAEHVRYVTSHGEDLPEVRDWVWTGR
jgi:xylulose-5-phosphate/fructose-6-phosphate phosphoketolase